MDEKRIAWIDGIKGYACMIVLFGHSVACIFPNMIFGNQYKAHSVVELFCHITPINILFASGFMNAVFLFVCGFLISRKNQRSLHVRIVHKYLKFIPMICGGGIVNMDFDVLKTNISYSIN